VTPVSSVLRTSLPEASTADSEVNPPGECVRVIGKMGEQVMHVWETDELAHRVHLLSGL
jgi:hypothetical protein